MSATIERPAGDAMVASPPDQGGLTPETLATLESIERRLLSITPTMSGPTPTRARSVDTRRHRPR